MFTYNSGTKDVNAIMNAIVAPVITSIETLSIPRHSRWRLIDMI